MSLEDSEHNYSPAESENEDLRSSGVRRIRERISVIVQGGLPGFYRFFLQRNGIREVEVEEIDEGGGKHRISTARKNEARLRKLIESMKGVSIVNPMLK